MEINYIDLECESEDIDIMEYETEEDEDLIYALYIMSGMKCGKCHVNTTPQWRRGPSNTITKYYYYCNACGLKYKKNLLKFIDESEGKYEVGKILDHCETEEEMIYLVRWKGYGSKYDLWVPLSEFNGTKKIDQYWRSINKTKKIKK